ncbi:MULTISPECIES: NrsF family protein [unclassified Bradyrhizobium]|uniref:NrsF family protein n=1 Tax=unclassified Bradyrhizobium TaxID=2631580 RepID=UPI002917082B|nr:MULTISPECIES: NrsF family protein [unclassified Bradyrhizobium]
MIKTTDLIDSLATDMRPVKRLRPPLLRACGWLLGAAAVVALLAVNQGIRPDLAQRLHDTPFVMSLAGSILTGVLAVIAAFLVSLPDRSRLWMLLPLPALMLWLSNIGYQCLTDWVSVGPDGMSPGEAARCFTTLLVTSLPLSLALLVMLRYAARLRPTMVALMGGLAVSAITSTALALFHSIDASVMILMWNLGTAALLMGAAALFGRRMFLWGAPRVFAQD